VVLVYTNPWREGQTRYLLNEGERRFWEHVYLSVQPDSQARSVHTEFLDEFERTNGEDIERMKWSINMQRESVCAVDIAEFFYMKRNEAVRVIKADGQFLIAR
jgi:hypothetical protein